MDWLDAFLGSGMRFTTPILLAALGCLVTSWTRDLNVGLEGAMIFGAFFGVAFGLELGSGIGAIVVTLAAAAVAGLLFGILITTYRVNVFVAGIVLNVFGAGATVFLLRSIYGVKGALADDGIPRLARIDIPVIGDIPLLGGILSGHTVLTYLAWVLVGVTLWAVRSSVVVRHLKAAGEHPEALETAGGNVQLMRIVAQVWCFMLCALAGAQMSIGQLSLFTEGMTSGLGFVAVAAAIFSRGNVLWLAAISTVFGLSSAAGVQINEDVMPPQFAQMIPYVVALVGLVVLARTSKVDQVRIATPQLQAD